MEDQLQLANRLTRSVMSSQWQPAASTLLKMAGIKCRVVTSCSGSHTVHIRSSLGMPENKLSLKIVAEKQVKWRLVLSGTVMGCVLHTVEYGNCMNLVLVEVQSFLFHDTQINRPGIEDKHQSNLKKRPEVIRYLLSFFDSCIVVPDLAGLSKRW